MSDSELNSNDLLPCPFCGHRAEVCYAQRRHDFDKAVECDNESCGVFIIGPDCVSRWNNRRGNTTDQQP